MDKDLAGFLATMLIVFVVIFGGAFYAKSLGCANHADRMGIVTHFDLFGGCYAERNGRMVRMDDYKYIELMENKQ